jgi:hypothetical protein
MTDTLLTNPLFKFFIVKTIAEQRKIELSPGGLIASAVLPGVMGLVLPLALAQNGGPLGQGGTSDIEDLTTVPDVSSSGMTSDTAQKTLKANKLNPVVVNVYHEEIDENLVVDQDPIAGISVPVDSDVTLRVSLGKSSAQTSSTDENQEVTTEIFEAKIDEVEGKLTKIDDKLNSSVKDLEQQIKDSQAAIISAFKQSSTSSK